MAERLLYWVWLTGGRLAPVASFIFDRKHPILRVGGTFLRSVRCARLARDSRAGPGFIDTKWQPETFSLRKMLFRGALQGVGISGSSVSIN